MEIRPAYIKEYLKDPEHFYDVLLDLDWITQRAARHEYFMSLEPTDYSYGNRNMGDAHYTSKEFHPEVKRLLPMLNYICGTNFNGCFLNKYDNQHQHLGWHADDFEGMDQDAPIAVISLGAEREIWFKPKGERGEVPKNQRQLLHSGSLFIMPKGFQDVNLHRIPKHDRPCGCRISLTFRKFS